MQLRLFHWFIKPLIRLPVTPNQVTTLRLILGVAAGFLFAGGTYFSYLAGGILFEISLLLDNLDGEIARARGLQTPWGERYDILADLVTLAAFYTGLAAGLLRDEPWRGWWLWVGAAGLAGYLLLAGIVWLEKRNGFGPAVHHAPHPEGLTRVSFMRRLVSALSRADVPGLSIFFCLIDLQGILLIVAAVCPLVLAVSHLLLHAKFLLNLQSQSGGN